MMMMSNLFWNEGRGEFQSAFSDTDFPFAKVATVAHTSVVSVSVVNSTRLVVAHTIVAFAANRHSATAVEEMTAVLHLWNTLLVFFFFFFHRVVLTITTKPLVVVITPAFVVFARVIDNRGITSFAAENNVSITVFAVFHSFV